MSEEDYKKELQRLLSKEVSTKQEYIDWFKELVRWHLRGLAITLAITIEPDEDMADKWNGVRFRAHMVGSEVHLFDKTAGLCLDNFLHSVAEKETIRDHDDILRQNAEKVGLKYG